MTMYDKVRLSVIRTRDTPDITPFLDDGQEVTNLRTGEVNTFGSLGGLKVSVYTGWIVIYGSLPKFHYGSNIYPLDRQTTRQALERIEDRLCLSLSAAKVTALEFGNTFVMEREVAAYIRRLGKLGRMERIQATETSLYYRGKGEKQKKEFVFYDKGKEMKEKGIPLPIGLEDANLLRYELRMYGSLCQQINVPKAEAATLSDKVFYEALMRRYQEAYTEIKKMSYNSSMDNIKTVGDGKDWLFSKLLNEAGAGVIDNLMAELKANRIYSDRKYYTRLKKELQGMQNITGGEKPDKLIRELDDAVLNCGAYL